MLMQKIKMFLTRAHRFMSLPLRKMKFWQVALRWMMILIVLTLLSVTLQCLLFSWANKRVNATGTVEYKLAESITGSSR